MARVASPEAVDHVTRVSPVVAQQLQLVTAVSSQVRQRPITTPSTVRCGLSRAFSMTRLTVFTLASIFLLLCTFITATKVDRIRHDRSSLTKHGAATAPAVSLASAAVSPSGASAATWSIRASQPVHAVNADLWGIFFEEYAFSGEGGLYQQQIQNTNFETTLATYAPWQPLNASSASLHSLLQLDTRQPLNAFNPTALLVTTTGAAGQQAGVINPGFWGISLINRTGFDVSLQARSSSVQQIVVSLTSQDGSTVFGSVTFSGLKPHWTAFRARINVSSDEPTARFQITYLTTAAKDRIAFDAVSLMPSTGWNGLPFIRPDLGQLLADMRPSFVRFPGGCYIEGDRLANRYNWKRAIGPLEDRTGHWNFWGHALPHAAQTNVRAVVELEH